MMLLARLAEPLSCDESVSHTLFSTIQASNAEKTGDGASTRYLSTEHS